MPDVQLASRAARELRKLDPQVRRRILAGLAELGDDTAADIKAIAGHPGWLRLRVGDHRVIYRTVGAADVYLVARVVDRRDLDRAIAGL